MSDNKIQLTPAQLQYNCAVLQAAATIYATGKHSVESAVVYALALGVELGKRTL